MEIKWKWKWNRLRYFRPLGRLRLINLRLFRERFPSVSKHPFSLSLVRDNEVQVDSELDELNSLEESSKLSKSDMFESKDPPSPGLHVGHPS